MFSILNAFNFGQIPAWWQWKRVSSHLTACSTLLSRGLRLGSLVDDRIPVPQLLARVFLMHQKWKRVTQNRGKQHPSEASTKIISIFYIKTSNLGWNTCRNRPREMEKEKPVKEGSQQPSQQHLVSSPGTHMTVHELRSWNIHRSTCREQNKG